VYNIGSWLVQHCCAIWIVVKWSHTASVWYLLVGFEDDLTFKVFSMHLGDHWVNVKHLVFSQDGHIRWTCIHIHYWWLSHAEYLPETKPDSATFQITVLCNLSEYIDNCQFRNFWQKQDCVCDNSNLWRKQNVGHCVWNLIKKYRRSNRKIWFKLNKFTRTQSLLLRMAIWAFNPYN
jgi:hypothetical protein